MAGAAPAASSRCADCTLQACALRGRCGGQRAAGLRVPALAAVGARLRRWAVHSPLRRRGASGAVLAVASVAAVGLRGPLPALAWLVALLLALWWSAPRSGVPGWPGLLGFVLALALLAPEQGLRAAPLAAAGLALGTARAGPGRGAAAWALLALGWLVARGPALGVGATVPLLLSALGAAGGALAWERRRAFAREQSLLAALGEAQALAWAARAERGGGGPGSLPGAGPLAAGANGAERV